MDKKRTMAEETVDLGCGENKAEGAVGVDHHPYPGVDIVADLNETPLPLEEGRFSRVICTHMIEHIADPVAFLREVHRISKPGARVEFVTPHFSSINSWSDPTHRWHLSSIWYEVLLPGGYLSRQVGAFELISSRVIFGKALRCLIPKAIIRIFGMKTWEKHYGFVYPAKDIETVLRVVK